MGVSSQCEARILGIFTAQTTRFYLAVLGSENGLNGCTSKLGVRSFSWFLAVRPPSGSQKSVTLAETEYSTQMLPHTTSHF